MGQDLEGLGLLQGLLPSKGEVRFIDLKDQYLRLSLIIDLCLQLVKTVDLDPKKNYHYLSAVWCRAGGMWDVRAFGLKTAACCGR